MRKAGVAAPFFLQKATLLWLVGISAVLCLVLLPNSSYPAAVPLIREEWHLSNAQTGIVFSAYQAGYIGAVLFLLPLTDRIEARWILIVSAALSVLGNALFPILGNGFLSGSILRALAGVGLVGVYMPGLRLVAERFADQGRGGAVGIYVASFTLGTSISLGLTGVLIPGLGWRGAYLAVSLAGIMAPILAYFVLRGPASPPAQRSSGRLSLSVLANRPALLMILGYVMHSWELSVARLWVGPFLAAVLMARGQGRVEATGMGAAVAALLLGCGVLGTMLSGFVSDRFGRTRPAALILTTSALCSFSFGWLGGLPWGVIVLVGVVYGLALAADSPIYSAGVTELATPGHLGSTMAVQSFTGMTAMMLSPVVSGFIMDIARGEASWGLGLASGGLAALVGVAALVALGRMKESRLLAQGKG